MKGALKIGRILAWFNLVYWGFTVVTGLLQALAAANMAILIVVVLLAAVPLNAYASLQLHRSIRNPEIKLNHQTPVGIRFVGTFVILIGILLGGMGLLVMQGAKEFLQLWKDSPSEMKQLSGINTVGQIRELGAVCLVFGIVMIAGALINIRLLRWYYLVKQSDVS